MEETINVELWIFRFRSKRCSGANVALETDWPIGGVLIMQAMLGFDKDQSRQCFGLTASETFVHSQVSDVAPDVFTDV